ncbi:glutathione S-transferase family protein [Rhizobium oryziradicis]|uniref:Glutathione S-transferase n=1 Tax=Rhizobium oryziradicis TaxID=1867956 RepID=A0A1Q8ZNK7_9HYPH|nr:glutathione S-transferase family protein [Rhizobium oryziradicis]OLP43356.1 glutathione S-transferase [Rhizobium oryziradicis]
MSAEVTLYTHPRSRGRMVRWMLEEIGQPYKTEWVAYGPQMKSPEFLSINPVGKIPAIRHGSTVVTETPAILAYLADAFPDAGLAPPLNDRGAYYRWLFFVSGPMEAAVVNNVCGFSVPDDKRAMMGYGNMAVMHDAIEAAIKAGPYIAGSTFTAADLYLASHLSFEMNMCGVEKRPAFKDYVARMTDRDAFRRATAIDNTAIEKPTA